MRAEVKGLVCTLTLKFHHLVLREIYEFGAKLYTELLEDLINKEGAIDVDKKDIYRCIGIREKPLICETD